MIPRERTTGGEYDDVDRFLYQPRKKYAEAVASEMGGSLTSSYFLPFQLLHLFAFRKWVRLMALSVK
jgi:hypothetical protein